MFRSISVRLRPLQRIVSSKASSSSLSSSLRVSSRLVTTNFPRVSSSPCGNFARFSTSSHQEHKQNAQENWDPRESILQASLKEVPVHGWSQQALAEGAAQLGYPSVAQGMFARGAYDLVDWFMADCNQKLREDLKHMPKDLGVTGKVRYGVWRRLQYVQPYLNTWPQAMALGALPQFLPTTASHIGTLCDDIWHAAGDQSTDYNWYTKRALLAGVYASTELYMLTDASPNFADTAAFLDRRLQDVLVLGKVAKESIGVASALGTGLFSLTSAALPQVATVLSNFIPSSMYPPSSSTSSSSPFTGMQYTPPSASSYTSNADEFHAASSTSAAYPSTPSTSSTPSAASEFFQKQTPPSQGS